MKTLAKIILPLSLTLAGFSSQAVAEEIKIGVIDMRTIVTTSTQAKDAMEKLKKEFKGREDKIIATEKSLKEKSEKLQRNSAVMSEAEKLKLEKEVIASQRELQRMQTEFREDAQIRQQEEMKKLVEKINGAVAELAKKEKYDLVIHSEVVPFSSKNVDITDKVMKAIAASA